MRTVKTVYKVNDVEVSIGHFYKFIEGVNEKPFELIKHEFLESWLVKFLEMGAGKADTIVVEIYGASCVDITYHNGDKQISCFIDTVPPTFSSIDMNGVEHNHSDVPALKKALDELASSNPYGITLSYSDIDTLKIHTAVKLSKKFNCITAEYRKNGHDVFNVEFEYTPSFAQAVVMGKHQKKHEVMLAGYEFFIEEWRQSHPDTVLDKRNK